MDSDLFLIEDHVQNNDDAMTRSLQGALQRNPTYIQGIAEEERKKFRGQWKYLIREASIRYAKPAAALSDAEHCNVISMIARKLSHGFGDSLRNEKLRFGTSQKALNLYLKYLWRMGLCLEPPHCPIDSIVLAEGKISGKWTECDSEHEYMDWINVLRKCARDKQKTLAEWEYGIWLERALRKRTKGVWLHSL